MEARIRVARRLAAVGLCLALGWSPQEAHASGVDGAGRTIVIPLVISGPERMSLVTIANPGNESIQIDGLYIPAKNTPVASNGTGARPCPEVRLDPDSSLTLALDVLCPIVSRDVEDFGYLELHSKGDATKLFLASAWTETAKGRDFAVDGYPVGSFDAGRAIVLPPPFGGTFPTRDGLRVTGLFADWSGGFLKERVLCYVASLEEPKTVILVPHVNGAPTVPASTTVKLRAREMQLVDLTSRIQGVSAARVSGISVDMSAGDAGQLVGGCAVENVDTRTLDYQPAHTPLPKDASRLREVTAETGVMEGPYQVADFWSVSPPSPKTVKVVLTTYLQSDDQVRCNLVPPSLPQGNGDPTPWLEMRVVDPDGVVRAGGNGATDTGLFSTGLRNSLAGGYQNRWRIEIGPDEDALARVPFGPKFSGTWAVHCKSAAGMSIPLTVWNDASPVGAFDDDF